MNNWNFWDDTPWLREATYYLDPLHGSDSNPGTAPNRAWATYAKAESVALSPGQSILKKVDGRWILFKQAALEQQSGWIVGYFQDNQTDTMPVPAIDFGALTHICHDAVEPNADGSLDTATYGITAARSSQLISAAHAAGVKALVTIADVTHQNFVSAASPANLETFVGNPVELVVSRGYDGIDIDWETGPAMTRVKNLMAALYPAIKAQNPNLLVTMAAGVEPVACLPSLPYADMFTVMCYGVYWSGGQLTWLNCPLFDGNAYTYWKVNELSTERIINRYLTLGFPASKLLQGIPFYGMLYGGNIGTSTAGPLYPRQPYTAGSANETYVLYSAIPSYYTAAADHWDDLSQTPYLSLQNATPALNQYLTYDDDASITAKIKFGQSRKLGGLAIWEISADYFSSRSGITNPLLNTVKAGYPKIAAPAGVAPAAPAGLTAAGVSATRVTLDWPVVPAATSYHVKRSSTSGSGYATLATLTAPGYTDTAVTSGSTYYYAISALDGTVEGANSSELAITAATLPPPTNLLTTDLTNAAWSIQGTGASITSGTIYQSASSGVTALAQTVTVSANTNYVATLSATLTAGSSGWGTLNINTPGWASVLASQGQQLSSTTACYQVSFNSGSNTSLLFEFDLDANSLNLAVTLSNLVVVPAAGSYVTAAPSAVTITPAVATNTENLFTITLGWAPVAGANSYNVKRSIADGGQNLTVLANTTAAGFTDATLGPDAHYYYAVTAIHGTSESANSALVSETTPFHYAPPNALTNPNAIDLGPWLVQGTGASATGATTLQCASSGDTFLSQGSIPVSSSTNYTATITVTPAVGCWSMAIVYDQTYTTVLASEGQWILPGIATILDLSFNTGSIAEAVLSVSFDANANGSTIQVAGANVSVAIPAIFPNLLHSPADITNAAWALGAGTATGPLSLQVSTTGATLSQQFPVAANTNYLATISVYRTDSFTDYAGGYAVLMVFGQGWAGELGMLVSALLTEGATDLYVNFNSGENTNVVFSLNVTQEAAGAPVTLDNLSVVENPSANADIEY